ncbi:ATPase, T2SS/T4P/T4SS family [Leisingera sp. XS_AS12]|uniref:ATPase, T2SS/T4P/T4SS family n=1 Tax=Leisingera sp. XS_AS12 TaxID=3241294 RepID=UPI003513B79A
MFGRSSSKPRPAPSAAMPQAASRPPAPPAAPQPPAGAAARPPQGLAPQLMPEGDLAKILSAYNFIDLYISNDPLAPIMARGLRAATIGLSAFGKGLVRLPEVLYDDATRLYEVIDRKWKHSDYKREFTVVHDERSYRCALIAPPDFRFTEGLEPLRENEVRWCIRQVSGAAPSFEEQGLSAETRQNIQDLIIRRGLVICSGPFASGKTTLASSIVDHWVAESRDVGITLEDPPEIPLARVTEDRGVIYQIDLMDRSVRDAIKHARRWSPRYVFLGEVRTGDVASELLHMAISGPLAICTIHASDPVQAIVSLFRFASSAMSEDMAKDMISAALQHVFHQEMVSGRVLMKQAKIHGVDNHLIRSKIKAGNFRGLYEDFERQVINSNSPARAG